MVKEKVNEFSCLKCGMPFEPNPVDNRHDIATGNEKDYENYIKVGYRCIECGHINHIYWGYKKG